MEGRIQRIHSVAPIRICDLGGWTDTWFARRGAVLNIACEPHVEVEVLATEGSEEGGAFLHPEDYGGPYRVPAGPEPPGPHPLLEASIASVGVPEGMRLDIGVHSDAPPGAGAGTSSAVAVALIAALDALTGAGRGPAALAEAARRVETERLHLQCGVQDPLASAFGGINFIEVTEYPHAVVTPLLLSDDTWSELGLRLVVIFLGRAHHSSALHDQVIGRLGSVGPEFPALTALRRCAAGARDALLSGQFEAFGRAMAANSEAQAELHPDLVSPRAARVIEIAREHGALGWKVNGAGGEGGSLTLLCGEGASRNRALVREIEQEDPAFRQVKVRLSRRGARAWRYSRR
jgi:D-glycero-alpha-D-manno-heptose-7-phosphate kinase